MPYETQAAPADEKPEAGGKSNKLLDSAKLARHWQRELDASKKFMARFTRAARRCEKAYLDEHGGDAGDMPASSYQGKVNTFWANVQVTLAAIYGRLPKAEVDRKFKDYEDDVSRVAGMMMARILNGDIEREHDDTNSAMRDAVQDRFVSGLGQVWCRYEVETEEYDAPMMDETTGQPVIDADTGQPATQKAERIINEEAETDYVYWDDFRYSPCRRWRECRWVARRVYMSEKKLGQRFKLTDAQLQMIPMQSALPAEAGEDRESDVLRNTPFKQAAVWEIWEREGNYVCWYVEGCSFILDQQDDILQLDDFFPCPQPVVATTLTKAFRPRPDYAMAQDLYKELDRINAKISNLTQAIKAAGVYDKTAGPIKQLLTTGVENNLIPVDNWSAFVERGGMKGVCDWLPIEQFVNAVTQLSQRKAQLERDLYEVLGISDIMRGASMASETATAQQLKVQYGGARLANLQNDVARFVSAVMRIRANIVSNHFQPETIIKRSLIERTPDAPFAQQAVQLLKDFGTAMFSINVTADSLAAPDWQEEKAARVEYMGATSNFIMAAAPLVQGNPAIGAFLLKLLQWGTAGFKGSRAIEGVLDQASRQLEQQAQQPPPPAPPSPQDQKDTAQAKKYEAEAAKTQKEADLVPPLSIKPPGGAMPPGGGPPGAPGGPPMGGPPPGRMGGPPPNLGPAAGAQPLPAAPGTVAPLAPQMPAPLR